MSHPQDGAAAPASATDLLNHIREYAAREARRRELQNRYRDWLTEWQQDHEAVMVAIRAVYHEQSDAHFAGRAPNLNDWLPHLRDAGRVIGKRGYLDLVTPTERTSEWERYGYELLRTAATAPDTLPAVLAELSTTNWPMQFTWQHIYNSLGASLSEHRNSELPSEIHVLTGRQPAAPTPDPFEEHDLLTCAAADLQSLAAEFRALGEELRGRLNAVLSSGRRWEALFDVGPHIPGPAYEQSLIRVFAAEGGVSPSARARTALERLIEFAVRQDRPGFDAMLAKMRASSAVTAEAEERFPKDILRLLTGLYKHRRAEFRQRADAILAQLGMRLMETHTADTFRRAGIPFPREAEFVLNYLVDPNRDVVWFDRDGEQLLPFGSFFPYANSPSEGEKSEEEKAPESHAVSNSQPVLTSADLEELRLLASNKLKSHQKKAVLLLCDRGGCVPLREVAETCKWVTATQLRLTQHVDCDGKWNSLRNRLNKQRDLKLAGWNFYTLDKVARVQRTAASARK